MNDQIKILLLFKLRKIINHPYIRLDDCDKKSIEKIKDDIDNNSKLTNTDIKTVDRIFNHYIGWSKNIDII